MLDGSKVLNTLIVVPIIIVLDAVSTYIVLERGIGIEANYALGSLGQSGIVILNVLFAASLLFFIIYCKKNLSYLTLKYFAVTKKLKISHLELCVFILACVGMARSIAVINNVMLMITGKITITNYITLWLKVSEQLAVILIYTSIVIFNFFLFAWIIKKRNERSI